jgi:hypothetical protein
MELWDVNPSAGEVVKERNFTQVNEFTINKCSMRKQT